MQLRTPAHRPVAAVVIVVVALAVLSGIGAVFLVGGDDRPTNSTDRGGGAAPGNEEGITRRGDVINTEKIPDLGKALVDPDEIIHGGPPPDGIPPIDDPKFLSPSEVDFLPPQEPVLAVEVNGDARAYPLRILMWHEIVNDVIGGVPVTVTYCPLCNTGIAFERPTVDGQLLDFGTSGKLFHSNLVMYDRQTESYWAQATGQAIVGDLAGIQLEFLPAQIVSWEDWRATHPDGKVLSQDTGFDRNYGQNPYAYYDDPSRQYPGLFTGEPDPRMPPMTRVLGIRIEDDVVAFPYPELVERSEGGWAAVHAEIGGKPVVVLWNEGTASALDSDAIAEGRNVGAAVAYSPVVAGRRLTFEPAPEGLVDRETGSVWNTLGRAISGPLRGTQLKPVTAVDHFWFSWAAFFPETTIFGR